MADIPPGYAVLSRVDYKNTVFNQFVCPIEEIATYKVSQPSIPILYYNLWLSEKNRV